MSSQERYPRRAQRARETCRRITAAASELFVEHGYQGTTVTAIAERSDVAPQTFYATFGTKHAVLATAIDVAIAGDDDPIPVNDRPWMRPVWDAPDAPSTLRAYASAVRLIQARVGALLQVLDLAAAGEPELSELHRESDRRRRLGASGVVEVAAQRGRLGDGLEFERAVDIAWTLNGHDVFLDLTRECGWSHDEYESWLADTLIKLLLHNQ